MLFRVALAALSIAVTVGVSTGLPAGLGAAYRAWQDRSHAYPAEEVAAFKAACTRNGGDPAACTCLVERLQARYTWGAYRRAMEGALQRGALPPEWIELFAACAGEQRRH
jgi:hypothetical protein